jgi:hypothetical protein
VPVGGAMQQPALLILLAAYSVRRDRKGAKWCRRDGIGAVRAMLGAPLPDGVPEVPAIREYREAQRGAIEILEHHCRICGRCDLANAQVTGRPHLVGIPASPHL